MPITQSKQALIAPRPGKSIQQFAVKNDNCHSQKHCHHWPQTSIIYLPVSIDSSSPALTIVLWRDPLKSTVGCKAYRVIGDIGYTSFAQCNWWRSREGAKHLIHWIHKRKDCWIISWWTSYHQSNRRAIASGDSNWEGSGCSKKLFSSQASRSWRFSQLLSHMTSCGMKSILSVVKRLSTRDTRISGRWGHRISLWWVQA